jgi:hypothetical protein
MSGIRVPGPPPLGTEIALMVGAGAGACRPSALHSAPSQRFILLHEHVTLPVERVTLLYFLSLALSTAFAPLNSASNHSFLLLFFPVWS